MGFQPSKRWEDAVRVLKALPRAPHAQMHTTCSVLLWGLSGTSTKSLGVFFSFFPNKKNKERERRVEFSMHI